MRDTDLVEAGDLGVMGNAAWKLLSSLLAVGTTFAARKTLELV